MVVSNTRYQQRLVVCESCEHYREQEFLNKIGLNVKAKFCGKAITGETITYEGEEKTLCGCIMAIKAKGLWASCPLGKWPKFLLSPVLIEEAEKFIKKASRIKSTNPEYRNIVNEYYQLKSSITGRNLMPDYCDVCFRSELASMKQQVEEWKSTVVNK
jgi:hypothetical protein